MALVQMRTPGGSYSMVDENVVSVYEAEGWVLTSDLPEFKTKDVTYYDEARKTVTSSTGEEKPVEEVITTPGVKPRETSTRTLAEVIQDNKTRGLTTQEWEDFKKLPINEKEQRLKELASQGVFLTSSQKYAVQKTYNLASSDINNAEKAGKEGQTEKIQSGPLQPGQAGYGITTWFEFLGYGTEDDAMRDFSQGKLTPAEIRRAEAEIQPDPADIVLDTKKVGEFYGVADSDWARVTPSGKEYLSLLETIEALENSDYGRTTPGQNVINNLKTGTTGEVTVSGNSTGNPNLGEGNAEVVVIDENSCGPGYTWDSNIGACVLDVDDTGDDTGDDTVDVTGDNTFVPDNLDPVELNNIPVGAEVWDVEGTLYLAYAVPGAGDLYTGSTIWMAYNVVGNDLFEAGLLTEGFEYKGPNGSPSKSWFDKTAILSGNTNQLIGMDSDPFASFVETYKEEALLRPWLLDNQFIELQAEAALENRDISEAEWRATTWYQTHNQAERDWMDIELSDPAEAQRQRDDLELYYKNQLQALGVSNVPDGLIQWVSSKNITGTWSDLKTAEQLQLFADPYKTGERDTEMLNLISTSGFGDVDRTAAREKEVVELYRKWLGPSLGSLTQDEVASIAGRLRDDPDYEDALVNSLKQSRLAAFSNYTNPELTYEDIARPWRNLTTSVWGQTADETQGWWQEMVKSNDYSTAQTTLREKGLEQNINQVSVDASKALQNALGQGSVSQTGVNV
jgi:hypothetical protein